MIMKLTLIRTLNEKNAVILVNQLPIWFINGLLLKQQRRFMFLDYFFKHMLVKLLKN